MSKFYRIGENLNVVTKVYGQAMKERNPKPLQELALKEAEQGVDFIDVNIGPARKGGEAWATRGVLPSEVNSGGMWISFLYSPGSPASTWNRGITFINGDLVGSNERYNLGYTGDGFTVRGVFGTGNRPTTNWQTTQTSGNTYLIVAKYDFGAAGADDGRIDMWVNPDVASLGTGLAPTGGHQVTATGISDDGMRFNGIGMYAQPNGGGTTSTFDEFRVGQSWVDVSPVPEPAGLALLAGVAGLALRRRSR